MTTPIIITEHLTRRFEDNIAVHDLNLEVRSGEVFGFLGHNGAGKTTTVRLLNGVLEAHAGKIRVMGLDPINDGPALRARLGVLTESISLDNRLTGDITSIVILASVTLALISLSLYAIAKARFQRSKLILAG